MNSPYCVTLRDRETGAIDAVLVLGVGPEGPVYFTDVPPGAPVYLSAAAKALCEVAHIFVAPNRIRELGVRIIKNKRFFQAGAYRVTPSLVENARPGASAYRVEHGAEVVDYVPEGGDGFDAKTVAERIGAVLKAASNITLLLAPAGDVRSIVAGYQACLKTGKIFAGDILSAFVCDKLRKSVEGVPVFNEKVFRIRFIRSHIDALAKAGYRDLLYAYNQRKIDNFAINRNKEKILMLVADDGRLPLATKEIDGIKGATLIALPGEGGLSEALRQYCDLKGLRIETGPGTPGSSGTS